MTRRSLFVLPLVIAAATTAHAGGAIPLGSTMPSADVKMKNVDGKELTIADVKGSQGMLVVFTCNQCPFAKAWESRIVDLGNDYQAKGVGVIAINPNDPKVAADDNFESMQVRAKEKGFEFPYVVDATSDVARAFGAAKTPEVFLFDKSGKLVYHGAVDDNGQDAAKVEKTYLHDALEAVVDGQDVPVAETKSIGCSIKFRS